jgi:hypothetical protein
MEFVISYSNLMVTTFPYICELFELDLLTVVAIMLCIFYYVTLKFIILVTTCFRR